MKKKGIIIGIVSAAVVVAAAIILVVNLGNKEDVYRIIKVMSVSGKVMAQRESIGELDAYEGMVLQSGDNLHVSGNSRMVMTMDEDKVAYVEENTQFQVVAEGTSASSKTHINVQCGAVNCEVRNKLSDDSSYEVNTPNSTIAIRGTDIRVNVLRIEDIDKIRTDKGIEQISQFLFGRPTNKLTAAEKKSLEDVLKDIETNKYKSLSRVSVFDGKIDIQLKDEQGNPKGDPITLEEGKEVYIGGSEDNSKIIIGETEIDLATLPQDAIENLQEIKTESGKVIFSVTDLEDAIEAMEDTEYTVKFTYKGNLFATQTVPAGGTASKPSLKPTKDGEWDADFSEAIQSDSEIKWIEK